MGIAIIMLSVYSIIMLLCSRCTVDINVVFTYHLTQIGQTFSSSTEPVACHQCMSTIRDESGRLFRFLLVLHKVAQSAYEERMK